MSNKRLNVDFINNQSNNAISIDEARYKYPASEHEYYTEADMNDLIKCKKMAEEQKYPTKELNAFVLSQVEKVFKEVAVVEVNTDNNVAVKIFASKKQSDE